VSDTIYVSSDKLHMIVFGLPPGGESHHSDANRTIFGADLAYFVLEGTLNLANPETGEVQVAQEGETLFFRRDTWHHIFAHSLKRLRVLEFFAPPPSTGASQQYGQRKPLLTESRYADDSLLGTWPMVRPESTLHLRRDSDVLWRRQGDALVAVVVTTEHLTVATLSLLPGGRSTAERHSGDECLYVVEGVLNVRTQDGHESGWFEIHPEDGFYCPAGVTHEYHNISDSTVKAVLGVAPRWQA
jgi:quercetin dioxygenase-like cupin family protein